MHGPILAPIFTSFSRKVARGYRATSPASARIALALSIRMDQIPPDTVGEVGSSGGAAELDEDGLLTGEIRFHDGDNSAFEARRR